MVLSSDRPAPPRHGRAKVSPPSLDPRLVEVIERRLRSAIPNGRTVDVEDAADLRQATWLRLLERLEAFEQRSSLETFATGVAFHVVREKVGRAARRRRLEERFAVDVDDAVRGSETPLPLEALDRRERCVALDRHLSALPDRDRFILRARGDEASYGEILPIFRQLFGDQISTEAGLRTLYRNARMTLAAKLGRG